MSSMIGVVLAGGTGRRMGRTKGDLVREGISLASRAASVLANHCERVLISVAPGGSNPAPGFAALEDALPGGRGPLGGIDAAFRASDDADLLVLACDYPLASSRLLGAIAAAGSSSADLVFPRDPSGRDHPLCALWRRSSAAAVAAALREERLEVLDLCRELRIRRLEPAAFSDGDLSRELLNWNRPEELGLLG